MCVCFFCFVLCAGGAVDLQTEAAVHVFAQSEMRAAAVGRRVAGHRSAAAQRARDPTGNRHVRHQTVFRFSNSSLRTEVRHINCSAKVTRVAIRHYITRVIMGEKKPLRNCVKWPPLRRVLSHARGDCTSTSIKRKIVSTRRNNFIKKKEKKKKLVSTAVHCCMHEVVADIYLKH